MLSNWLFIIGVFLFGCGVGAWLMDLFRDWQVSAASDQVTSSALTEMQQIIDRAKERNKIQ